MRRIADLESEACTLTARTRFGKPGWDGTVPVVGHSATLARFAVRASNFGVHVWAIEAGGTQRTLASTAANLSSALAFVEHDADVKVQRSRDGK